MFRRSGSVKGVNVIVQFLLHRVDPVHTKETFKAVWPIIDRAQEKDFRRLMFARLSELERDGHLPQNSVRLSDLTSAKGDRLYGMLWHLSNEALRRSLARANSQGKAMLRKDSIRRGDWISNGKERARKKATQKKS